jgi:membrane protease YdiL (CAAX protease family)
MSTAIPVRYIQTLVFVAVYIALGFIFKLGTLSYLVIGIPLTLLFQLLVVKKPLHQLWLRDETSFNFNRKAWFISVCFLVFPVYRLIDLIEKNQITADKALYYLACMLGAFGAGYCYSKFTKKTFKEFLMCFGIIAVVRMSLYFFPFVFGDQEFQPNYFRGLESLLTYIPVAFVAEEVVFRGMLDAHICTSDAENKWYSMLFISFLWGLWHLPLLLHAGQAILPTAFGCMALSLWGVVLSYFWRRSGNLAVPAFPHALADAIRDAVK